jgi:malic enzyme
VFDIELDAADPDDVVRIVKALEPTFGGINLEDISAPQACANPARTYDPGLMTSCIA